MAEVLTENRQRKQWLDALRALAIVLVVYFHMYKRGPVLYLITSPVKIPLFFAISGYLIQPEKKPGAYFLNLLSRIIVPWLVLGIGSQLIFIPFDGIGSFLSYIPKLLLGEHLWYIPCFLVAQTLFYLLNKCLKKLWQVSVAAAVLCGAGLLLAHKELLDVFKLNTALIVQAFLLLGLWLKRMENRYFKLFYGLASLVIFAALAVLSQVLFPDKSLNVHTNYYYGQFPLCFLMVASGCFALFALSSRVKRYPRWIRFIGENSLIFYLLESMTKVVLFKLIIILPGRVWLTWYMSLVLVVIELLLISLFILIVDRFAPRLLGKKRKVT